MGGGFSTEADAAQGSATRAPPHWPNPERPWCITRPSCRADGLWTNEVHYVNTGTVKWFNETKGYGFIQPDDGGKDVFVHISAVERAGMRNLIEGQRITYEILTDAQRQGRRRQPAGGLTVAGFEGAS